MSKAMCEPMVRLDNVTVLHTPASASDHPMREALTSAKQANDTMSIRLDRREPHVSNNSRPPIITVTIMSDAAQIDSAFG